MRKFLYISPNRKIMGKYLKIGLFWEEISMKHRTLIIIRRLGKMYINERNSEEILKYRKIVE